MSKIKDKSQFKVSLPIFSEWILVDEAGALLKNSLSNVEIFGAIFLNFCDLTHWTFSQFITNV